MYDPQSPMKTMRSWVFVTLGLWHIFRHAQLALWKLCEAWFSGPLFKFMFPGSKFNRTPRHKFLTWLLSLVRLNYKTLRTTLQNALENNAMDPASVRYLTNLQVLLEYYIPMVLSIYSSCLFL